jgi:CheY-like chemotaxis protein
MNAPTLTWPHATPIPAPMKKKRVLLIDSSRIKRDLRSETMRRLGAEVDCAADIPEARCWWRADLYDLVLIQIDDAAKARDKFCDDIRKLMPHQQIMFLVGKPKYLAPVPKSGQEEVVVEPEGEAGSNRKERQGYPANGSDALPAHWGILEACQKISAVRSVYDARTRAIRDRPLPKRDSNLT